MTRKAHHLYSGFAGVLILLAAGCYDRWTGNYDEFPDLSDSKSAILDETGLSPEDHARRLEELKALAGEKEPQYTINAGDSVEVKVYNHADLAVKTTVTPDGYIGMMFAGQVRVAGLTLAQAAGKIEKALEKYIRNPKVGISPYAIHS